MKTGGWEMESCRRSSPWIVAAAALCCPAAWPAQASADFMLDARYTGVVTAVQDTYGVFGSVALGESVGGIIRYSAPARPPDIGFPDLAEYRFPVTPGGGTLMTASLGALDLRATRNLVVDVYNIADPISPPDSIYGYSFQFNDGDVSRLRMTGLPRGFQLSFLDAVVGLFATDPSLIQFPNPPSTLLPVERYDSYTGGLFTVQIRDANGRFVESAAIEFQLTSLTAVPEPSSALLAGVAFPLIVAWAQRRRSGRNA
ncbi:MAG: hypothetical protein WKF75_03045 [Singulisphaera sp.]